MDGEHVFIKFLLRHIKRHWQTLAQSNEQVTS